MSGIIKATLLEEGFAEEIVDAAIAEMQNSKGINNPLGFARFKATELRDNPQRIPAISTWQSCGKCDDNGFILPSDDEWGAGISVAPCECHPAYKRRMGYVESRAQVREDWRRMAEKAHEVKAILD